MFGYIRICKPQMKICEYEVYQSVYCTLCRKMGKDLGLPSRFLLNYDYTFLAMIMIALSGNKSSFTRGRCVFNPVKKCGKCTTHDEAFEYTSALTAIMFYHKLRDNVNDSAKGKKFLWHMLMPYANHVRKKAAVVYPDEDALIDDYINRQFAAESKATESGTVIIDELCEPTANTISAIAEKLSPKESDKIILRHFGYFLGRWIYLIDALDDLKDDIAEGTFNPLALKYSLTAEDVQNKSDNYENARCFGNDSLNMSVSEAIKYYELLDFGDYKPILDNIMYLGISEAQRAALFSVSKKSTVRLISQKVKRS